MQSTNNWSLDMVYVLAPNNVVEKYPYTLTDMIYDNPQTSFPETVTDEDAAVFNVFPVVETLKPIYDPITQNLVWVNPVLEQSVWIQQWAVEQATPEEVAERQDQAKQNNKAQAEQLLQQTDWTATVDISNPQYSNPYLMNQDAFLAYRSQVRQIAINPPVVVDVWPVKPNEVWSS